MNLATEGHIEITARANEGMLNYHQFFIVLTHNIKQDINQIQSKLHFDNCTFKEGIDYINSKWEQIENPGSDKDVNCLINFGELLHTVQDFYSHSNWIELHVDMDPVPTWDLKLETLPTDIVSGTWRFGMPKKCSRGGPNHNELNKDNPHSEVGQKKVKTGPNKGKTLFTLAYDAAIEASRIQFERFEKVEQSIKLEYFNERSVSQKDLKIALKVVKVLTEEVIYANIKEVSNE